MISDIYKLKFIIEFMAYNRDVNIPPSDESTQQMSKINSAGLINATLEKLWLDCYNAMASSNLSLWNKKLDAIWVILGGDCEENGAEDKEITTLDLKIYETGPLSNIKTGFEKPKEGELGNKALQYILLKKKSLFLRRLQNKQGKGTAYKSDDDDDFD